MDNMTQATKSEGRLQPCLSPAAAWALAVGTSVGWDSPVVTGNPHIIGRADDPNVPVAAEGIETEELLFLQTRANRGVRPLPCRAQREQVGSVNA